MSSSLESRHHNSTWWQQLGLTPSSLGVTGDLHGAAEGGLAVLREYEPVAFASKNGSGDHLTIHQLRERIADAESAFRREAEEAKASAAERRRQLGWEKVEAAYASSDADEPVTEGRWAGFSRADATAWCWNLFQYEPHGFVHPGTEVRYRAMTQLESGGLPEVFGYPERALALQALGLTPKIYRQHKEVLGAVTFTGADVTTR